MAIPEPIELDKLLAPISADAPAGISLRGEDGSIDPGYDAVKTAAQDARMKERELLRWESLPAHDKDVVGKPDTPNWRRVEQEAIRVLETRSKDLWVAAWLIEGLVRTRGFAGFRDGCHVVRVWVEQFWEHLHPMPGPDDDEDPVEYKVSQLAGLNGTDSDGVLIVPLRNVALIESDEFGPLSLWQYNLASKIATEGDPDTRQRRLESSGTVSIEQFEKAMLATPPDELAARAEIIGQAIEELVGMDQAFDERCRAEDGTSYAPPTSTMRAVLEECRTCLGLYLKRVRPGGGIDEAAAEADSDAAGTAPSAGKTAGGGGSGPLQSREDAFRMLQQVADFFRRTEPHSPVSYALEQAVRWGRLPLPELLRDLINDESVRSEVYRRTGIPPPRDDSDS